LKFKLGIDEAGRGPVIGPLVIVGVEISEEKEQKLREIGVKDSKELTREQREELYKEIEKIADKIYVKKIWPIEINEWMSKGKSLNELELKYFAEIINESDAEEIYIDTPSPNPKNFKLKLLSLLKKDVKIIAENKADKKYPIVSAASIIAKVERDREIEKLKERFGDFGSGYPSDPKTRKFLEDHWEEIIDYIRVQWKTFKEIIEKKKQKSLIEFIK